MQNVFIHTSYTGCVCLYSVFVDVHVKCACVYAGYAVV